MAFALSLSAAEVRVFAAASLTDALTAIAAACRADGGDRIVFNFAGSSTLARQIEMGAPADLFASADAPKMDALERKGLIVRETRVSFLSSSLVVVVPREKGMAVSSPRDLLRAGRIALGEPASVPVGIYAKAWLVRAGIWTALAPRVIPVENVRAALAAVESGDVNAAIVYRTDALISSRVRIALEVARDAAPHIEYPFAVTTEAASPAAARQFLRYLQSEKARAIFRRYGFVVSAER